MIRRQFQRAFEASRFGAQAAIEAVPLPPFVHGARRRAVTEAAAIAEYDYALSRRRRGAPGRPIDASPYAVQPSAEADYHDRGFPRLNCSTCQRPRRDCATMPTACGGALRPVWDVLTDRLRGLVVDSFYQHQEIDPRVAGMSLLGRAGRQPATD